MQTSPQMRALARQICLPTCNGLNLGQLYAIVLAGSLCRGIVWRSNAAILPPPSLWYVEQPAQALFYRCLPLASAVFVKEQRGCSCMSSRKSSCGCTEVPMQHYSCSQFSVSKHQCWYCLWVANTAVYKLKCCYKQRKIANFFFCFYCCQLQ